MARPKSEEVKTPDIHIIGLKKLGPHSYAVVTGTVANPVVDSTPDRFEFAVEAMKLAGLKMIENMP